MAKRKDKTKLVGQLKLPSSRKPYYFQVFLWETIEDLREYFEVEDETLAMTCFEPWYVDEATGNVYINPKLGEMHFARDNWNTNVVSHECMHAIVHRMRLVWPPAHLILLDEYADAEEEIAYELGHWVEKTTNFLWTNDPPLVGGTTPWVRKEFELPTYISDVRFPKSSIKLVTGKATTSKPKTKGPTKKETPCK